MWIESALLFQLLTEAQKRLTAVIESNKTTAQLFFIWSCRPYSIGTRLISLQYKGHYANFIATHPSRKSYTHLDHSPHVQEISESQVK